MKVLTFTAIVLLTSVLARADSFDIRSLEIAANGQQTQVELVPNGNILLHGSGVGPPWEMEFLVDNFGTLPENQVFMSLTFSRPGHRIGFD